MSGDPPIEVLQMLLREALAQLPGQTITVSRARIEQLAAKSEMQLAVFQYEDLSVSAVLEPLTTVPRADA